MRVDGDYCVFSDGAKVYINGGIVGLGPDLETYGGYDGDLGIWVGDYDKFGLTDNQRQELANYMIAKWTEYKNK